MKISNCFCNSELIKANTAVLNTNNADIEEIKNYIIENVQSHPYLHILIDKLDGIDSKLKLENRLMSALFEAKFDTFDVHTMLNSIINNINEGMK